MGEPKKIVVTRDELELDDHASPDDSFAVSYARIGPLLGLTKLGCALQIVPPGKKAFPFHRHHANDEMMVILEGAGEYRWGDDRFPIKAGDIVGAPMAREAHQIINSGTADLVYLAVSTNSEAEVVEYPDSGKIACRAGAADGDITNDSVLLFGRLESADFWDGEI